MKQNTNSIEDKKYPYVIINTTSNAEDWLKEEKEKANKDLRQFCQDKLIELLLTGGIKRHNEIHIFMSPDNQIKLLETLVKLIDLR